MNGDDRCEETRELLPELALGIADGADRDRVLEHVAECKSCRDELERFSSVADGVLLLAPAEEPPPGFELGVLREIHPPPPRRRRGLRRLALVGAVAGAVAVTAASMMFAFRDDRRLADHYRTALAQAHGTYFGASRLVDAAGRPGGVLYAYRGNPSWILVTVSPARRAAIEQAELVTRDGRTIPLRPFRLVDGAWGGSLPVDLRDVASVHLVAANGRSALVGTL
jgi:hypothetical protein